MRDDSKATQASNDVVYDNSGLFRAVRTHESASFIEDDRLIWQAQYYDETSLNEDNWERGSFYATPQEAIEGAKRGKATADMLSSMFE